MNPVGWECGPKCPFFGSQSSWIFLLLDFPSKELVLCPTEQCDTERIYQPLTVVDLEPLVSRTRSW